MFLTHLSLTSLHDSGFWHCCLYLIIIRPPCTYRQTVGGRNVNGTSGLILQLLVSPWCIVLSLTGLFKCLLISGNTNKQDCQPAVEDKEWRGNGRHSSPRLTGIVLEQAPVSPTNNDHRGRAERETEREKERSLRQSEERKRAPDSQEKVDQSV